MFYLVIIEKKGVLPKNKTSLLLSNVVLATVRDLLKSLNWQQGNYITLKQIKQALYIKKSKNLK